MKYCKNLSKAGYTLLIGSMFLTSCSQNLVKDYTYHDEAQLSECSGSEWTDDSTLAVIPIPIVAFLMPHTDLNTIKADDYLKRCGDSTKLVNREVAVNHAMCVPTVFTRILTLGIWQWCPANVSWEADVRA